jgi:hypothetical protein
MKLLLVLIITVAKNRVNSRLFYALKYQINCRKATAQPITGFPFL